ncbi:MAG: PD-(D/E)XK nuclease family protein [Flavobacterium sp.]
MESETFLQKLAVVLVEEYQENWGHLYCILPNKRAKVFLLDHLQKKINQPCFAPKIISIEDFIGEISNIQSIDDVALLFEFYAFYKETTPKEVCQTFEQFSNWASTLLRDFNEIDRYLLEPNKVFDYLKEIEVIKRWEVQKQDLTDLIKKQLHFWEMMPVYYQSFYDFLIKKKTGYQGLIYREAVKKIESFCGQNSNQIFVFAGFNALNQAEDIIIQTLISNNQTRIFWDIDKVFLEDPYHDAGYFARKTKSSWKHYKTHPFSWIDDHFSQPKNIEIIGTPKTVGQAKIVGQIIENHISEEKLHQTAVVLGNEHLLIPLLNALPQKVPKLNITMGFNAKNNPAQLLVYALFKMHHQAINRDAKNYVFYHKDVIDLLTNPLVAPFVEASRTVKIINQNNFSYITKSKLFDIHGEQNEIFQLLFTDWTQDILTILKSIQSLLIALKNLMPEDTNEQIISKTFIFSVYKTINQLDQHCQLYPFVENVSMLFSLYKQMAEVSNVSFEGEPLEGLQLMGILESRVLDFENVIITSLNEGTFPAGKSTQSFIPMDVKRELGLPTFKEKDAIYTYHFYHLLQRAKNIYLIYNTESEGIDAGEMSRFITQLLVEPQKNHQISHHIYNAALPKKPAEALQIKKSELLMLRLKEIANTGFSPSSLSSYLRNPLQFYFQKVLRINELDAVEENIAANTLGSIVHGALENLYTPFLNQVLTLTDIELMESQLSTEVLNQFKKIYKEGDISKGKNLLAFEVAKRYVFNFLMTEKKAIQDGETICVLALESEKEILISQANDPFPIKIKGNIDRIEMRNGVLRIIDYKSGKVEIHQLKLSNWEGLTLDLKNDKIIQLLCYALMCDDLRKGNSMEVGIVSFKNMKAGFMPCTIDDTGEKLTQINNTHLEKFKTELLILIDEIMNPEIAFLEKLV